MGRTDKFPALQFSTVLKDNVGLQSKLARVHEKAYEALIRELKEIFGGVSVRGMDMLDELNLSTILKTCMDETIQPVESVHVDRELKAARAAVGDALLAALHAGEKKEVGG